MLRTSANVHGGPVGDRRVTQHRLHDQLHGPGPGLSAPTGHGRALKIEGVIGQAVLGYAAPFAG